MRQIANKILIGASIAISVGTIASAPALFR